MLSTIKHLSFGLIIGMLFMLLIIFGLLILNPGMARAAANPFLPTGTFTPSSTNTATPTLIPTFTLTFTPTPTLLVIPTNTPSKTPSPLEALINSGGLIFTGPLSNDQQLSLYEASLNYIAPSIQDSTRVSIGVNGVGYGDPTNICGPLAIAIMRDAGIVAEDIAPHDFWLLNPVIPEDRKILNRTFPANRFSYMKFAKPLNQMDWRAFPLQPGDFLFIWHGSGGNFDHMLVVNRVDSNLRAYAVTNYGTPNGFTIAEVMLYDPADPNAGIFHTWTMERNRPLGSTGFGGFELWRLRTP